MLRRLGTARPGGPRSPALPIAGGLERVGMIGDVALSVPWHPHITLRRRPGRQPQFLPLDVVVRDAADQVCDHVDSRAPFVLALPHIPLRARINMIAHLIREQVSTRLNSSHDLKIYAII